MEISPYIYDDLYGRGEENPTSPTASFAQSALGITRAITQAGQPTTPVIPTPVQPDQVMKAAQTNPSPAIRAGSALMPDSPATANANIDPNKIDQIKFIPWYTSAINNANVHPDPHHPDHQVSAYELFNKGAEITKAPNGTPIVQYPDGKVEPLGNKLATIVSPTQIADQTPTSGAQLLTGQPQDNKGELAGKLLAAGGLAATALDRERFGAAGAMMVDLGQKEVGKARANAAAKLLGYPSAEALEAAKAEAGMRKTLSESGLERAKSPYYTALTQKAISEIPETAARTQGILTDSEHRAMQTKALEQETRFKAMMPPITLNLNGQQVTVQGEHAANAIIQNMHAIGSLYSQLAQANLSDIHRVQIQQQLQNLNQNIAIPGPNGQMINLNPAQFIDYQRSVQSDWAKQNAGNMHLYDSVMKPLMEWDKNQIGAKKPYPPNYIEAAKQAVNSWGQSGDPFWKTQALVLGAMIGGTTTSQPQPQGGAGAAIQPSTSKANQGGRGNPSALPFQRTLRNSATGETITVHSQEEYNRYMGVK